MRNKKSKITLCTLALGLLVAAQFFSPTAPSTSGMALSLLGDQISLEQEAPATFVTSEVNPFSVLSKATKSHAAVNSEVKGWLMIPGTNINMPVNYSNKDNNYYLYRDWKGNNYPNITWRNWYNYPDNTTYVDYRHRWGDSWQTSSKNVVLYGHNWSNLRAPFDIGSNQANDRTHRMFGQLPSYTSIEFAKWQPHIYFSTADYEGIWRVFAVGYCEISPNFFYNNPNPTKEQRQELISEWRKRSHFNFDVDVNADDVLLTLTTCTRQHGSTENQRFVVVARLLRPGESEKDSVNITHNPNIKHPDFTQPVNLAQLQAQQVAAQTQSSAASETPASDDPYANYVLDTGSNSESDSIWLRRNS
ncbi:MAG: class B sortase [Oscillospiraceae bacterium]|jgi:SrtB family sortase